MTEWGLLRDAYGVADRVPGLLAAVEAQGGDGGELWDELWGRLCHQGTVYSASYAALPTLAGMSARHARSGFVAALQLAAAIVGSDDGPEDRAVVRERYVREIAELSAIARRNLGHALDDTEFLYGLQVLAALEDWGLPWRALDCLASGEASFECPACGEDLLVNFDAPEPSIGSFADASLAPSAVVPAATVASPALGHAQANDRPAVAEKLRFLYGVGACPECGESFEVLRGLA